MNDKNMMEKKINAGSISATVWKNVREVNGSTVEMKSVSLQRSYKDKNGEWKNSATLRVADIPKAKLVLDKVYEYLTLQHAEA